MYRVLQRDLSSSLSSPLIEDLLLGTQGDGVGSDLKNITKESEGRAAVADVVMAYGRVCLAQGDLEQAADLFAIAARQAGANAALFVEQGRALLLFGVKQSSVAALSLACKKFKEAIFLSPDQKNCLHPWGQALYALGALTEKAHYFASALAKLTQARQSLDSQLHGYSQEFLWDLGLALFQVGVQTGEVFDLYQAREMLRSALEIGAVLPSRFWEHLAQICLHLGDAVSEGGAYKESLDYLNKALELDEQNGFAWILQAELMQRLYKRSFDLNYLQQANESFSKALALRPHHTDILKKWVQFLCEVSGNTEAEEDATFCLGMAKTLVAASSVTERDLSTTLLWIESLSRAGFILQDYTMLAQAVRGAEEVYETAKTMSPDICFAVGITLFYMGRYLDDADLLHQACEKFQQGVSLDRTAQKIWGAMGQTFFCLGEMEGPPIFYLRALLFFQRANLCRPLPQYAFAAAEALAKLGIIAQEEKWLQDAAMQFQVAIERWGIDIAKGAPSWFFHYGIVLHLLGDLADDPHLYYRSLDVLIQLIVVAPHFPSLHHRIALVLSQMGELIGEEPFFDRAFFHFGLELQKGENNEAVLVDWGVSLLVFAKTFEHSEEKLVALYQESERKLVCALRSGNYQAFYYLGCLYSLRGNVDQAVQFLLRAHENQALPALDELLEDEWLEPLKDAPAFISLLEEWRRAE